MTVPVPSLATCSPSNQADHSSPRTPSSRISYLVGDVAICAVLSLVKRTSGTLGGTGPGGRHPKMEQRVESSARPHGHWGYERWKERLAAPGGMSMNEPGNAPERDVLLATKLHVPHPPPGFVPRPRLTARLDEGRSRRMT